MKVNPAYMIVMSVKDAVPFLDTMLKLDPMRWNHRLRITYKKYGASVYLHTDSWTASDPDIVRRYIELWAKLFPHHMMRLKIRRSTYQYTRMWIAPNVADVEAVPIKCWKTATYLEARVSIVYQEYLNVVNNKL